MKNVNILLFFFFVTITSSFGQSFLQGYDLFSNNQESYFTMSNGEELVATIDKIKRKKGLIMQINVKLADGQKRTLKPDDIKSMFLPPSGFDKLAKFNDKISNLNELEKDRSLHQEYVKEGYVYFENCEVQIKKKTMKLLMQLVNPGFASKIKVFHDPYAAESASIGVGGLTVAGGIDKSYYIKKGDDKAFRLLSKDYRKLWKDIYGNCKELEKEVGTKKDWKNFEQHVYFYDQNCM
jgi:hypothetical protein